MKFRMFILLTIFITFFLNCQTNKQQGDKYNHIIKHIEIYASHDEECQEDFWMKDWHVFSSDDLINWKDHGACLSVNDISWADNYAWAPDCAFKNGKYYFCFPAGTGHKDRVNPEKSTKWMGIGIGVSESPTGPFAGLIAGIASNNFLFSSSDVSISE